MSSCTCYQTDPKYWTRYGSAVEPGSQWEPNPDCTEHFPCALSALDAEALQLFHAGTTQRNEWAEFTDRQKDHWRAVAAKAREIHAAPPIEQLITRIEAGILPAAEIRKRFE